jgi:hypothetical protein
VRSAARYVDPPRAIREPAQFIKRCGVCGQNYEPVEWDALPAIATLPPATVKPYLSVSADWSVELRTCLCGTVLAARGR